MNPEITKLIEQYLANELSPAEKIVFEKQLADSEALQKEVLKHQTIHQGAKRAATRTKIQQIGKVYHIYKKGITTGIVVAAIVVISSLTYLAYQFINSTSGNFSESKEVKALIEKLSDKGAIENLASEFFFWTGADSVMISKEGVLLSVPKDAFLLNGKPYNDKAIIQWQEAIDPSTILKSGLSTMADDRLLETQGMFGIQAYTKDGKKLDVNPKVGIYVQAPVDQYKEGMQLFTGEKGKEGIINWINPKHLQKIPVAVDMKDLDFYPKGYEAELNQLKKQKAKKYRDSLYLSFENEGYVQPKKQMSESSALFENKCASCHQAHREGTGPKLYRVRTKWADGGAKEGSIFQWVNNRQIATAKDPYAQSVTRAKPTSCQNFPELSDKDLTTIFDYLDSEPAQSGDTDKKEQSLEYPEDKVKYKFDVEQNGDEATIICRISIVDRWRINAVHLSEAAFGFHTSFGLKNSPNYKILKEVTGPEPINTYDKIAGEYLSYYKGEIELKVKIKILNKESFIASGGFAFQTYDETHCLVPFNTDFFITINGKSGHISPSKVIAFWQPAFNKTLLATREFEKRMQSIHKTCDNAVLELYTKNLSKTMQEIDEMAVAAGHPEFAEYVKEQVGALNPNSPHVKGLQSFYDREIQKLKNIVASNRDFKQRKENQWDKEVQKEQDKEANRSYKRATKNLREEYNFNLDNVYEQLGKDKKQVRRVFGKTVGFIIWNPGVYNIDKYVMDATVSRTSATITDPETGKTAKITYNPFSFKVKESENYDKLYAYLFPSQLNSYQRISGSNGKFDYPLNGDIHYDLAIVGISDKGYFYTEQKGVSKGDLGAVTLTGLSEKELDAKIKLLNESRGIIRPMVIADELKWLVKEQLNYKEQKKRKEDAEFREKIKKVIFPCGNSSGEYLPGVVAAVDSVMSK